MSALGFVFFAHEPDVSVLAATCTELTDFGTAEEHDVGSDGGYLLGSFDAIGSGIPFLHILSVVREGFLEVFMELIQDYWYNFSATGDPNGKGRPEWKKYTDKFDIINLNNTTAMIPKEEQAKYEYYYEKLQNNNFTLTLFGPPKFTPKN